MTKWSEAQVWESDWWGDCANTYGEEEKQWEYAKRMGLEHRMWHNRKSPYNIDMAGRSVLDIGGGPCSLLLKCTNVKGKVVDPLVVPEWVAKRYDLAGIAYSPFPGEDILETGWDEIWIYNCLQHTRSPRKVIRRAFDALKNAPNVDQPCIRLFEWVQTGKNVGHPHAFTAEVLDKWLGGQGKVETLDGQSGLYGACYYGIFVPPVVYNG